jgi:methionyl-tRNA synthetase
MYFSLPVVDQHGQKVQQSAAKAGVAPAEFVKGITQTWLDLSKKLEVKNDEWVETTRDLHKKVVQGILQRLFDDGQIYKDKQAGYYSVRQEQFLTDKERGPDGQFGPEWGEIEFREEENYYLKLSQYKEWLLQYLDKRADAVIPDFRQTELRNAGRENKRRSSASRARNHGWTGESSSPSIRISSPTSGSMP